MNYTEYFSSLRGKNITVVGFGVSNRPFVSMLSANGANVTVRDKNEIKEDIRAEFPDVKFITGENYLKDMTDELIFKTPGMRRDIPEFLEAENRGSKVTSEMQLFFELCPCRIIAVTGSEGKTTTTTLIYNILKEQGHTVFLGGNIGTPLLPRISQMKPDDIVIAELSSFQLFDMSVSADTAVITNIVEEHLNWHTSMEEYIEAKKTVFSHQTENGKLILNADDPLVSLFGYGKKDVIWFGADKLSTDTESLDSVYNDGAYCPHCKSPMNYTTHHYNHIGHYECPTCGYKRHSTDYTVTSVDLDRGEAVINGKYHISLALKSLYNIYNILAAFTVASIVGIGGDEIAADMSNYVLKNGRVITFELGKRKGTLLTSKHENSISYDQSIRVAVADKRGCDVMFIVDAVSRKYFTSDVSWLWDIDFEMLNNQNIHNIVLAGKYCNDLAVRFSYTDIPKDKITIIEDINKAVDYLENDRNEYIYVITCFSDKYKFISRIKGE